MSGPAPASAEWRLRRDSLGIPHLWAPDELTLARAQGYVTARDRGWQLDTDRWRAEGTLAARIGPPGLAWDTLARQLRITETARRSFARLDDADRRWVEAYTDGVNAGLPQGRQTPETHDLRALPGVHPPDEPWPAWMPLAILHVNHVLFTGFPNVLWRAHVARTLGPHHPRTPVEELVDTLSGVDPRSGGSNAWALAGIRTATGAPILAGDPHRLLELPGTYQQVRLACPEYDVVGLAFPGVPGIAHFGHTGTAAWGVTNAVAHHVDVLVEHLRDDGGAWRAAGPDGDEPVESGVEQVHVRQTRHETTEAHETVDVPWGRTRRSLLLDLPPTPTAHRATGVHLPAHTRADLGVGALRVLLRARTARDVVDAFAAWVDPVNRVLAADRNTVLSATVGQVPDLDRTERRLPRDARTARAAESLPNAPAVRVTTHAVDANQRPHAAADHGFAYPPPHRARRITALLREPDAPTTAEDQHRIHADTEQPDAHDLLDRLAAVPDTLLDHPAARARQQLLAWDRRMTTDSTDATLYATWRTAVVTRLADHPALAPLTEPHPHTSVLDPWFALPARLRTALPTLLDAPWLDLDVPQTLADALTDAFAAPPAPWGTQHALVPVHLHHDAHLDPPPTPPTALAGDSECVLATASVPGAAHVVSGPVARWVWDLDDRTRSRWAVPFGAAGDPRSRHHVDQLSTWAAGRTTRIEFPDLQEQP
ncbi:penicillin acylase family protein [Paraoerskovia marina]|uniref:penicillin acylase family protein n=1 Tax=Paraoerskovia marina TaxID=545619 RepID=UPI000492397B|nr:penicillin acylase family protein [Paraoerskovia marina]